MRERDRERNREREGERERSREGGSVGERKGRIDKQRIRELGGQEIKSKDLSHLSLVSMRFFSGRTFTHSLKITEKKHAVNLGFGESITQKSCTLVPCTSSRLVH